MAINLPQNSNQIDPDFEPEDVQQVEQPVDPDFQPEDIAAEDPDFELEDLSSVVQSNFPNATGVVKEGAKRIFSAAKEMAADPNMQALDPATKSGMMMVNAAQGVFDETGEKVAEKLAYHGLNPYVSAAAGLVVSEVPNIFLSAEGIIAARAAGNAAAESEMLNAVFKKTKPLALEYNRPIELPTTILEGGEAAIPLKSKAMGLLEGNKPLALPEPNLIKGEGFTTRATPDLAKVQEADIISGQPKYPEEMGNAKTMKGYVARRRLSSDVPEFPKVQEAVAPADLFNPAMSELVDESRRQYIGIDPRLQVTKDMETGRTTFRLKNDPVFEKRVATEAEVISNNATKNSLAVKELEIDPRIVDSSPVLQGSEQVPVLKDGVIAGSKRWIQSAWNRIGVASEDVISRMGQAGKELANGIRTVRDVPQVRYGDFAVGLSLIHI